jgi:hypothetical protein
VVVSPVSARFPTTVGICLAIGHRAVPGEIVPPIGKSIICGCFFASGRWAEGDAQGDFFGIPYERVGVALGSSAAIGVEVARVRQGLQNLLHAPVGYFLDLEFSALEAVLGALGFRQPPYSFEDLLLGRGEGLPRSPQGLANKGERLVEVLFRGENAPFDVPFPLVLVEPRDDPHDVDETLGVAADAKRRARYYDAIGVGDGYLGGL